MAARLVLILLFVGISAVSPLLDLTGRSSVPLDVAFRCNDGRHVEIVRRCDASVDCVDGSDESSAACNAPNRTVSVGDKLAARVQYKREHGAIWIMICDGRECSTLSVSGATPTGALAYMAYTSCNMMGDQCGILHREEKSYDARDFASGGLVLELERRPTELAVWLQGFPEHTATVPTRRDDSFLRVRPLYWKHDMVVKFSGLALLASGVPFWCTNRLSLDAKCPCAEGCDEMACEAPNAVLQVGDRRTVRVQYKDEHWAVWFLLCDDCSCSKISVTGFSADGELAFWPATGCTNLGHHCRDLRREVRPRGPENFLSSGEIVFEAEKRDWELVVWLKGHSEYRATVPAKERSVIFKVRPLHWASEMPVKFADDVDVWGVPPFVCDDGRRVEGMSKCDGVTNCADGSDEAVSLCDVAATTLAVGNRRSVRVQYRQEHWAVWFVLCGEVDCSTVSVSGIDPDGSLHYWAYSNCTRMGDHCKNLLHSSKPGGGTPFPSGELKFEVERLRQEVSIWLKDRPDHKASIPLSHATICLLKVRPLMWKSNMIVRISAKCDEPNTFSCDEGPTAMVIAAPEPCTTMATGDTLEVRFYHKTAQGSIWIQLCNYNLCNIISLFGSTPDGELGFDAWAECKEDGRECTHHIGSGHPLGMEPFPEGDHVFRLQRRASDMLVSLRTHPQRAVTLIAGDSNTIVLVRPQFLNSTVVEEVLFERVGKNIALHAG